MTEFYTKDQADSLALEIATSIRQSTSTTRIKNVVADMEIAKVASDLGGFVAHLDEGYTGIINEFKRTVPKLVMSFSKFPGSTFTDTIEINGVMYNEDRSIDLATYESLGSSEGLDQLDMKYDSVNNSITFKNNTSEDLAVKIYTNNENYYTMYPGSDTTPNWDVVFKLKASTAFGGDF